MVIAAYCTVDALDYGSTLRCRFLPTSYRLDNALALTQRNGTVLRFVPAYWFWRGTATPTTGGLPPAHRTAARSPAPASVNTAGLVRLAHGSPRACRGSALHCRVRQPYRTITGWRALLAGCGPWRPRTNAALRTDWTAALPLCPCTGAGSAVRLRINLYALRTLDSPFTGLAHGRLPGRATRCLVRVCHTTAALH